MNLYQIYWNTGYEGETGCILCHNNKFSQKEFDDIVQESKVAIGGYSTLLDDIEEYMIKTYGFKTVEYMTSCT